jgi:hypothetical protein
MPSRAKPMSPEDTVVFGRMLRANVLCRLPMGESALRTRPGVIAVACADGHHLLALLKYHTAMCLDPATPDGEQCFHVLTRNGGGLVLSPEFMRRRHTPQLDVNLLREIRESDDLKDTTHLDLFTHWPCGAALKVGLDFEAAVRTAMEGFERAKIDLPHFTITPFLMVYAQGERRTYLLSEPGWRAWSEKHQASETGTKQAIQL